MEKSTLLHPQFFHKLVPGFNTHLTIPLDFFSKYIEGKSVVEKTTAELKSDSSDITWKVKMSGRVLSAGWEEFAAANNLQTGDVVLVRHEGDIVFHVSDLGPNYCDNNDVGDDDEELPRKKKLKKSSLDEETSVHRDCSQASMRDSVSTEVSKEKEEDMESQMEVEHKKYSLKPKRKVLSYSSYSPSHKRLVTFTLPPDYVKISRLTLPKPFLRENGINKPGEIYLLGKDGTKWLTNLLLDKKGIMGLGSGWKDFVKANGLETSFTLKLMWKGTTPMFSLCCAESTNDRDKISKNCPEASGRESLSTELSSEEENIEGESSEDDFCTMEIEKRKPKRRVSSYSSYSPCHKRLVTFTLPPDYVTMSRLTLPKPFLRENGINKPEEIYLLGKDGKKWPTKLLLDNKGIMSLGNGWKDFVKANGLETGFTLRLMWKGKTPVFSLCSAESASDKEEESIFIDPCKIDKMSKDENKREEIMKNHLRQRDSTPSSQKQFVVTIISDMLRHNSLRLPKQFVKENSMNKPGIIYLLGKDDTKWMANLVQERDGRTNLGSGWRDFAKANDIKPGESFTLESLLEDTTPMLRFIRTDSNNLEASKKDSISAEDTEPRNRNPAIQDRFVTLILTPEDVRACKLHLPSRFMKVNGINKLGKITLLGENKMEWPAYLLSTRDGTVALDNGWDSFCEANGVKLGEHFTLEFISEQGTSTVLRFCSQ